MRIEFEAIRSGVQLDKCVALCAVEGPDALGLNHYMNLQRADDDRTVYLEFDDQINGAYDCVGDCRLSRTVLAVDLSQQLGRLNGVEGFDIVLRVSGVEYEELRSALTRIFYDVPDKLHVA